MADLPAGLNIPIRETIDTAMPISDRPIGTLIEARDVASRWWGPKVGSRAFTRTWESSGTASLYDAITLNGTATTRGTALNYDAAFRDLGTAFTLDLWFRLEDLAYASAYNAIGLYEFVAGGNGYFDISVRGPAHPDHEKIRVEITTSPTRGTTDTLNGFTCSTRISTGTAQTNKQHVRLVRDGSTASLYLNGVLDGQSSGVSATSPLNGALDLAGQVILGYASDSVYTPTSFKGHIYGAVLRDGAFDLLPREAVMPCAPWARNVHHFYLGRNYALGGDDHFFDAGRFGAHARVLGAGYSVTASNDNAAPAPAPVQALRTWTTRSNRTATSVLSGGVLSTTLLS